MSWNAPLFAPDDWPAVESDLRDRPIAQSILLDDPLGCSILSAFRSLFYRAAAYLTARKLAGVRRAFMIRRSSLSASNVFAQPLSLPGDISSENRVEIFDAGAYPFTLAGRFCGSGVRPVVSIASSRL